MFWRRGVCEIGYGVVYLIGRMRYAPAKTILFSAVVGVITNNR